MDKKGIEKHSQRCDHYPVCYYVKFRKENLISDCFLCINDDPYLSDEKCRMDTRLQHSSAPQPAEQRIKDLIEYFKKRKATTVPTKQILTFDEAISLLRGN